MHDTRTQRELDDARLEQMTAEEIDRVYLAPAREKADAGAAELAEMRAASLGIGTIYLGPDGQLWCTGPQP